VQLEQEEIPVSSTRKKAQQVELARKDALFKEILAENERLQNLVTHLQKERQEFIQAFSVVETVEHSVAPDIKPFQSNRVEIQDSSLLAEKERILVPDNRPQSHIPRYKDEKDFFNSFRDSKAKVLVGGESEESGEVLKRVRVESTIEEEEEPLGRGRTGREDEEAAGASKPKRSGGLERKQSKSTKGKSENKRKVNRSASACECTLI
jgi:hypothetical protein